MPNNHTQEVVYAYKDKYNENHEFTTGLKVYNRITKLTEMVVCCHDISADEPALFLYNGALGNRWKFFDHGKTLLLPSHEKAGTILN